MPFPPVYRPVLRQAMAITLRHPALWGLGFFAAFLGLGGEYEFLLSQFSSLSSADWGQEGWLAILGNVPETLAALQDAAANLTWSAVAALLVFLIIVFVLSAWVLLCQGALFSACGRADATGRGWLKQSFAASWHSFWALLGIVISTRLLSVFVLAVIGLPVFALLVSLDQALTAPAGMLVYFVLGLPIFIIFSLVAKLAMAYRVLAHERFGRALIGAIALFADHWFLTLELALILFFINLAAVVLLVAAAAILSLPFLLLGLVLADLGAAVFSLILLTVALVFFLFLVLLVASALSTFQTAAWATLFLKIKDKVHYPKLIRLLSGWREKYG